MSTMSSEGQAARAGWLARAGRCLEDNHALLAAVLVIVLSALLGLATVRTFSKGHQDVDDASVRIAARMLELPGSPSQQQIGDPGYPLVLYAMAQADSKVAAAIACRTGDGPCASGASFRSVVVVQSALVVASLVLVLALAFRLSGLWETALLALPLTCLESRMGEFAAGISPLSWSGVLTLLYSLLALEAYRRRSPALASGAGAAVGVATLFSSLTLAAIPALAILLGLARRSHGGSRRLAVVAAFLVGVAAAAGLGVVAMSLAYDPQASVRLLTLMLSERVGFDAMGPVAWIAGMILPLPFLGGWLEFLFSDSVARDLAHGFAARGRSEVFARAMAQPGPALDQYWWLVRTHVLDAIGPYLAVTPPILNRGMWGGGGIIALLGFFSLKRAVSLHIGDDRAGELWVVFGPVLVLLAVSVMATANQFTHVPLLSFTYAYAVAYVTSRFPNSEPGAGVTS